MMPLFAPSLTTMDKATTLLKAGSLVAFPTETVYGLGADATSEKAVARIYETKKRPAFNPLIVHVPDLKSAMQFGDFNHISKTLASYYWPGPLTLVVPRRTGSPLSKLACAGLNTVALRVPSHEAALNLLHSYGGPLVAPSANPSGLLSPTTATHVEEALGKLIPMIIDGGPCEVGIESTVVGCFTETLYLLRPGAIPAVDIEKVINRNLEFLSVENKARAPGTQKSHYAPLHPLRMNATSVLPDEALLAFGPTLPAGAECTRNLSPDSNLREAATNLFAMLHELDKSSAKQIAVMPIPRLGLGIAINDRLRRASST